MLCVPWLCLTPALCIGPQMQTLGLHVSSSKHLKQQEAVMQHSRVVFPQHGAEGVVHPGIQQDDAAGVWGCHIVKIALGDCVKQRKSNWLCHLDRVLFEDRLWVSMKVCISSLGVLTQMND